MGSGENIVVAYNLRLNINKMTFNNAKRMSTIRE